MAGSTPAGTRGHGPPWKDISCYQASEVQYVKNRVQASGCGVLPVREVDTRVPNGIRVLDMGPLWRVSFFHNL